MPEAIKSQEPEPKIPSQYKGLDPEILEEIWQPSKLVDSAKNKQIQTDRQNAIDALKAKIAAKDAEDLARVTAEINALSSDATAIPRPEGNQAFSEQPLADMIPLDVNKPPKSLDFPKVAGGNMFGDNDEQTLAGKVIAAKIYEALVERPNSSPKSADAVLTLGREALSDFKAYINEQGVKRRAGGGREIPFSVTRRPGQTVFHLNEVDGYVSRDHLFYFNKSSNEYRDQNAPKVRAYLTFSQQDEKVIQRLFVDLCTELLDKGIDFTGKAASPNGFEKRTDNIVLYIAAYDQERAGLLIKKFMKDRGIGKGTVAAAMKSPDQDGLSWALDPSAKDVQKWQQISGSTEQASFNAVVAAKIAPSYLKRLAAAQAASGNKVEADIFAAEAARVEAILRS